MADLETRVVVDDDTRAGFDSVKRRSRETADEVERDFTTLNDAAAEFTDSLTGGLSGLGVAGAAGLAGGAVVALGARLLENANEIRAVGFETGFTTEQVQLYEQALQAAGFTTEEAREQIKSLDQAELDLALSVAEASGAIDESRIITEDTINTLADAQDTVNAFIGRAEHLGTVTLANLIGGFEEWGKLLGDVGLALGLVNERVFNVDRSLERSLQNFGASIGAAFDLAEALYSEATAAATAADAHLYLTQARTGGIGPSGADPFRLGGRETGTAGLGGGAFGSDLSLGARTVVDRIAASGGRGGAAAVGGVGGVGSRGAGRGGFGGAGGRAAALRLGDFLVDAGELSNFDIDTINRFAPGGLFGTGPGRRINFGQDISGLGESELGELILDVLDRFQLATERQYEETRRGNDIAEVAAVNIREANERGKSTPCPGVDETGVIRDLRGFVQQATRDQLPSTNPFTGAGATG